MIPAKTSDAHDRGVTSETSENAAAEVGPSPRLYQRAYDLLADEILGGLLAEGSELTETSVAARFGVSRAPARRALAELYRAGLVHRAEGRGYRVRDGAAGKPRAAASVREPAGQEHRLVPEASWERIYRAVESEVAARISFASWRVNEAELARHYQVSRTVARDVIARLQQRGLLKKDDRSRWVAPALTPEHVGELYELRWLLEPAALAKAAKRVPAEVLSGIHERLLAAARNARQVEGTTLDELERDLHVTLLGHCDSATLMQAIAQPQSLLIAHQFLYRWTARLYDIEPFIAEHLEIVEHVNAGRVRAGAKALEQHLRDSRDRAIGRIDVIARGPQPDPSSYLERLGR